MIARYAVWIFSTIVFLSLSSPSMANDKLVLTTVSTPPYGAGGDGPGFVGSVAKELFTRLNIEIDLVSLPGERSIRSVNEGFVDGELSRIGGMESKYPNLVMVPEKMLDFDFVAISKNGDIKIENWEDLVPYKIGMVTGWKLFEIKVTEAKSIVKLSTDEQLFKMLDSGRIDIALFGRWSGHYFLNKLDLSAHVIEPPLASIASFMYLNKKHQALVEKVSDTLFEMKQDGSYQEIKERTLNIYR